MHFTYVDPPDHSGLHQGDVIVRTPAIDEILAQIHLYYHSKTDYRYFIVLTQSCDLVRRDGQAPSARYITLAAVRPLKLALTRYVESLQYDDIERELGFCDESRKGKFEQFIEKLLNNNSDDYFYLHREPGAAFTEDHCAFLHLSIALKAHLHYDVILEAKRLQLKGDFQHKLGSIVGRIYSRVGTDDWVPNNATPEVFRAEVSGRAATVESVLWLEKRIHQQVVKGLKDLPSDERTPEKFEELVKAAHKGRRARLEELLNVLSREAVDLGLEEQVVQRLATRLRNKHGELMALLK